MIRATRTGYGNRKNNFNLCKSANRGKGETMKTDYEFYIRESAKYAEEAAKQFAVTHEITEEWGDRDRHVQAIATLRAWATGYFTAAMQAKA